MSGLHKDMAITIGHALMQQLDTITGSSDYKSYTLERAQSEAETKIAENRDIIFGEFRPADRNCAISVRIAQNGTYQLQVDLRNDFEDKPELKGGMRMQQKFIGTIESLDL